MPDYLFVFMVLGGGFLVGLVVGIARRHGVWGTAIDMLAAGFASIAFVYGYFQLLAAFPALTDALDAFGDGYPLIGGLLMVVTSLTPLIGAAIGLWIAARLRRLTKPAS